MNVVIVGAGYVGQGMLNIFPDAALVDPDREMRNETVYRGNACWPCQGYDASVDADLAVVCVPTPMGPSGECDTTIVHAAVSRLSLRNVKRILIKSTVTPGTTQVFQAQFPEIDFVFSPEYMGESKYHVPPQFPDPKNPIGHGFVILGGAPAACSWIADLMLPRMGPTTRFRFMSSTEAEIVKYAENSFFAMKVTFANELRRVCEAAGVNYHVVREGWIDDPRVNNNHSAAFRDERGFGGKCFPKDLAAFAAFCRTLGLKATLFDAVLNANAAVRMERI